MDNRLGLVLILAILLILGLIKYCKKEPYEATSDIAFNNFDIVDGSISIQGNKVTINNLQIVSKNKNKIIIRGNHPNFTFTGAEKKIPLQDNLVMILKPNGAFEILQENDGKLDRTFIDRLTINTEFIL